MTVQIAASAVLVSLFLRRIAMIKSKAITAERMPIVTNQVVVDSMAQPYRSLGILIT
jgi:hypothetical protein